MFIEYVHPPLLEVLDDILDTPELGRSITWITSLCNGQSNA